MAFLDLEKAFDNVNWNIMFHTLQEVGLKQQDLRILHSLYKHQTAEIKKGEVTVNVKIKKEVRQDCILSPLLFNCYIEKIINEVKVILMRQHIGVKIGGEIISMIRFADSIVLITESEGDIQRAINEMEETLKTFKMKTNEKKTKLMICARKPQNIVADIYLDNHKLDHVNEFPYLGSMITRVKINLETNLEIKRRIGMAKAAFSKKSKLFMSKKFNLNIKKRLIRTYVLSIALYGCETWVINETERKTLEALEIWCWRRIQRISWMERKRNQEVLEIVDEKRLLIESIIKRRWKIVGHTLRHPE